MATKMTAHGVSTTTTPGTEQYEVFYIGYRTAQDVKNITNTITATQMAHCTPAYVPHSKSADNVVMNGLTRRNNISQVVI